MTDRKILIHPVKGETPEQRRARLALVALESMFRVHNLAPQSR